MHLAIVETDSNQAIYIDGIRLDIDCKYDSVQLNHINAVSFMEADCIELPIFLSELKND